MAQPEASDPLVAATRANGWSVSNAGNATGVYLTGSDNADRLVDGAGNDTLDGHFGNDSLTGGTGIDLFHIWAGTDTVTDLGNGGADVLGVQSRGTVNATLAAAWTATTDSSNAGTANLVAAGYGVNLTAAGGTKGWSVSNAGNATAVSLTGSVNADTLEGGSGADSLNGGAGNDALTGGAGIDRFVIGLGTDSVTDLGNGGADVLVVSAGATVSATLAAAWTATAGSSNAGTANLVAAGYAVNLAAATSANGWSVSNAGYATAVSLTGSANADRLVGGTGADMLDGGAGNDILTGGAGIDRLADSNSVANSTAVWCLAPADQFGKQAVEGLIRRGVVECLPGPIVEAGGDQVEVALVQPGQGAAFRQVLAQQAVGVLVGAPLPG